MAVRATDPEAVQAALGLNQPTPCSWTEGMTGERKFFIGPRGERLDHRHRLRPAESELRRGRVFPFPRQNQPASSATCNFSTRTGFCIITPGRGWKTACVTRAYAWAGETVWNQGAKTPAETELSMKCFGYGEEPNADSWAAVEWTAANVGKVPLLAARWSLDPARINERARNHADGIAGESSRVY